MTSTTETVSEEFERRRMRVYVAGPISKGDVFENVMLGIRWGRRLLFDGLAPYVPHLDAYMTLTPGQEPTSEVTAWNTFLEWDLEWVASSEAVFRIKGASKGADLEVAVAKELGIPVYYEACSSGTMCEHKHYEDLLQDARELGLNGKRK